MEIAQLWRFPVKSLCGESLTTAAVDGCGLLGDRSWGIRDPATGYVLTGRRVPALLLARAECEDPEGRGARVFLPDGSQARDDAALSGWLGRPVALERASQSREARYESPLDFEQESGAWSSWTGPQGRFHDSPGVQISLLSVASMRAWDPRRFRANVVLSGQGSEEELLGRKIRIGTVEAQVVDRITRCVMVTRPQAGGVPRDLDVLRRIARDLDGKLGVGAVVLQPGTIAVGDPVEVL